MLSLIYEIKQFQCAHLRSFFHRYEPIEMALNILHSDLRSKSMSGSSRSHRHHSGQRDWGVRGCLSGGPFPCTPHWAPRVDLKGCRMIRECRVWTNSLISQGQLFHSGSIFLCLYIEGLKNSTLLHCHMAVIFDTIFQCPTAVNGSRPILVPN